MASQVTGVLKLAKMAGLQMKLAFNGFKSSLFQLLLLVQKENIAY